MDGEQPNRLQRQLDLAQQITHIGSWAWDAITNDVSWSDELYRIYGIEPGSVVITFASFLARVHPDDRDNTMRAVQAALSSGGRFSYPERVVRPDGSIRELETVGEAERDASGKVVGLVGTCRDVTDRNAQQTQVELYAELVRNVQISLSVWTVEDPGDPRGFRLLAYNPAAESVALMKLEPCVGKSLTEIAPYARSGELGRLLAGVARDGDTREAIVFQSRSPKEATRALAMKVFPLAGGRVGLAVEDITAATRARMLRAAEQRVLELIASSADLPEILDAITLLVEDFAPPAIGSILLLDPDGKRMRHGAAPHLPEPYIRAVDGVAIGPKAGSCGTAAALGRPVYVSDIAIDALWEDWRDLALSHGLRACWSTPIFARDGRVLGTFALYYMDPRSPVEEDIALIARATDIAGIAIQRRQLETQLRELSAHVERAREDERTHIARELHDVLGQLLTAMKLDLGWIARRAVTDEGLAPAVLVEKVANMSQLTDEVLSDVRRISAGLRPGVLDHLGLLAAFEWLAQEFSERTGTPCAVSSNLGEAVFDREITTTLFRILQEALTNVARHADAKRVDVRLDQEAGTLRLEVSDDGRGISAERAIGLRSLGLLGIRERARRVGGSATIARRDEGGTRVAVVVPFASGVDRS